MEVCVELSLLYSNHRDLGSPSLDSHLYALYFQISFSHQLSTISSPASDVFLFESRTKVPKDMTEKPTGSGATLVTLLTLFTLPKPIRFQILTFVLQSAPRNPLHERIQHPFPPPLILLLPFRLDRYRLKPIATYPCLPLVHTCPSTLKLDHSYGSSTLSLSPPGNSPVLGKSILITWIVSGMCL